MACFLLGLMIGLLAGALPFRRLCKEAVDNCEEAIKGWKNTIEYAEGLLKRLKEIETEKSTPINKP